MTPENHCVTVTWCRIQKVQEILTSWKISLALLRRLDPTDAGCFPADQAPDDSRAPFVYETCSFTSQGGLGSIILGFNSQELTVPVMAQRLAEPGSPSARNYKPTSSVTATRARAHEGSNGALTEAR